MGQFSAYGSSTPPPGVGGKGFFGVNPPAPVASGWQTLVTGFEASANVYLAIDFINSTFVISANNNPQTNHTVISSPDGVSWSQNTVLTAASPTFKCEGCGFGAGVYAYALDASLAAPRVYTSPDLTTWTQRNPGFAAAAQVSRPVFGNGVFLMVQTGAAHYATSPDGITWTQQSAYVPHGWQIRPIFDGTRFVAPVLGSSGNPTLAFSSDGIHWSESSLTLPFASPQNLALNAAATQYVVGNGSDDHGSALNATLTAQTTFSFSDSGNPTQGIAAGTGTYERINSNTATTQSSTDGVTWSQDTVPAAASFMQDIAHGLGRFIAIGGDTGGNNYSMFRTG